MGKVLKAVAIIAIAAAIAVYAPALTPAFLSSAFGAAAATAIVATVLTTAANFAFSALSYPPGEAPSGYRRPYRARDASGLRWVEQCPAEPVAEPLSPIRAAWWRDPLFYPWQRFAIVRLAGDCMVPLIPKGGWCVVDRGATIQPGDLFAFGLSDLFGAYLADERRWRERLTALGMVKRYLGTEPDVEKVIYDCTNPPSLCESGRRRLTYAYRVAAVAPRWWAAWRALRRLRSTALTVPTAIA